MALLFECMLKCAQRVLDTADIVRDGDLSPIGSSGMRGYWCFLTPNELPPAIPPSPYIRETVSTTEVRSLVSALLYHVGLRLVSE
jgi:hypothetical protein